LAGLLQRLDQQADAPRVDVPEAEPWIAEAAGTGAPRGGAAPGAEPAERREIVRRWKIPLGVAQAEHGKRAGEDAAADVEPEGALGAHLAQRVPRHLDHLHLDLVLLRRPRQLAEEGIHSFERRGK